MAELYGLLCHVSPILNSEDNFIQWSGNGVFLVESVYSVITTLFELSRRGEVRYLSFLTKLWKSTIPSKIHVFCWIFLLNCLPTKDQLQYRGIMLDSSCLLCPFYSSVFEDVSHLFCSCAFSLGIWFKVCNWLGIEYFGVVATLEDHFGSFYANLSKVYKKQFACFFWPCVCWGL